MIKDRWPKWTTERATRRLAFEINRMKKDTAIHHKAYRLRFTDANSLEYGIEQLGLCTDTAFKKIRTASLQGGSVTSSYQRLSAEKGKTIGVPGLVDSFCYDPLTGSQAIGTDEDLIGFGIIPVNDLTEGRLDRLSVILMEGKSAKISLN